MERNTKSRRVERPKVRVAFGKTMRTVPLYFKIAACNAYIVKCPMRFVIVERAGIKQDRLPRVRVLREDRFSLPVKCEITANAVNEAGKCLTGNTTSAIVMRDLDRGNVLLRLTQFTEECAFAGYEICPKYPADGIYRGYPENGPLFEDDMDEGATSVSENLFEGLDDLLQLDPL